MDEEDIKNAEMRSLWQRARVDREAPAGGADPLVLAAYLEGRLSSAEIERLEAQLAASAADLEWLLAARDGLGAMPEGQTSRVLERAKALRVSPRRDGATGFRQSIARWLGFEGRSPVRSLALAGAAGLYLALCVVTFDLGRQGAVETLVVSEAGPALDYVDYGLTLDDVL